MDLTLCVNISEKNKLGKTLILSSTFEGTLKEETSITSPVILLEHENPSSYNYAHIPDFGRYYFITDITSVRTGLWRISMQVDVLESFSDYIYNIPVILSDSESAGAENYLPGEVWKTKVKEKTDIISFGSGLSSDGHFILITAGG